MRRFFVSPEQIKNGLATIIGSDAFHIGKVLRLKINNQIDVLDGSGKVFTSKISSITSKEVRAKIIKESSLETTPKINVTIAQAIPKAAKFDLVAQKCTELGAAKIIPLLTERTIIKIEEEKKEAKVLRWQKIAKNAAEQCGQITIPQITAIENFNEIITKSTPYDLKLIFWEIEEKHSLKAVLQKKKDARNILILIGPEGGFSQGEVNQAIAAGFIPVSLGKRILRAETAALTALSMISYEYEQ